MFKKYFHFLAVSTLILNCFAFSANAIDLDEDTLTVPLDSNNGTVVLTPEQVKRGKRLFNTTCAQCHAGGVTKTNPNVGLEPESLAFATPARNNVNSLVSYMKNPLAYPVPTHGANYWKILWGVDNIPVIKGMLHPPKYFPIVSPMG